MNANRVENEKNLTSALITALASLPEEPTKEIVTEKARGLAALFCYEGSLETIINDAMIAVVTRMGVGVSLVDTEAEHDEEWVFKRKDIKWIHSDEYAKHLKSQRWHPTMVQSLSDVTNRILGHLQDPASSGVWSRRGLVIGHVQSGKTANYIGLVAKAADAGYKFIIVIAGIHNNLRRQTQERIDEGFIGRSSDPGNRILVGVGLNGKYPHPATLTTIYDDFNKRTAENSGWQLNDFSKPIILVIKKNVRTLDALHKWLKDLNTQGKGRISDIPMLLIDDEADNASINTNKPDLDPTRTNTMIRKILGLFAKSCYLGYTATPFANIFINPEAYDEKAYEDLFPRDFIYCLDAPTTYFGPDKVFLDDATSSLITEEISDCEEYIPWKHKKDDQIIELPPSLYRALHQFVLVRAIRNLRGQSGKHCSMMVNVSRFVSVQRSIRNLISLYEKKLREAVKANYAMPEEISQNNKYISLLREVFESDFASCGFSWSQVKAALWDVFETLRLYVINSRTDEALDYKKYERDGHGLTAIAIGGLSLSRGLTIEGLCVSYMYRNTRMYDTLMQMGRWFGYRPDYEDLCRVHLSRDSIDWYSHIADASEELREQIKRMRREGRSPRQFGLYVKAHPDSLMITAANKKRNSQQIAVKLNYSNRLIESSILSTNDEVNKRNEELIIEYWRDGFGGFAQEITDKGWIFRNISIETVENFLLAFQVHAKFAQIRSIAVDYLSAIARDYPDADILLISKDSIHIQLNDFNLGAQLRSSDGWSDDGGWQLNKRRVASRGDEKLGLSIEQQETAEREAGKKPSDTHYRQVRNKPLLMLHVLEPKGKEGKRVPAFGISFPPGDYGTEVTVVANMVMIEQMYGPLNDDFDDEDDFDEQTDTVGRNQ